MLLITEKGSHHVLKTLKPLIVCRPPAELMQTPNESCNQMSSTAQGKVALFGTVSFIFLFALGPKTIFGASAPTFLDPISNCWAGKSFIIF